MLKLYLYGIVIVGGLITTSNIYYAKRTTPDAEVLTKAAQRGLRYGLPWPMTLLQVHQDYIEKRDWQAIFRP
jgi:hypothetical protein